MQPQREQYLERLRRALRDKNLRESACLQVRREFGFKGGPEALYTQLSERIQKEK